MRGGKLLSPNGLMIHRIRSRDANVNISPAGGGFFNLNYKNVQPGGRFDKSVSFLARTILLSS